MQGIHGETKSRREFYHAAWKQPYLRDVKISLRPLS